MIKQLTTIILVLILSFDSQGQSAQTTIDSIIQDAVKNDLFEGTILIASSGKPVYHQSFGFTDGERNIPIRNSSKFSIASITKMITATIILQLVEEEKLQLSQPIASILPDLDIPNLDKITLHHLLLHISGLPNENDQIYYRKYSPVEFVVETLENKMKNLGEFNYANIDYVLLGLIIEKIDGVSWEESVRKRILTKTGMNETGFLKKDQYPDDFAYSFSYDENNMRKADPLLFIENYYAAGAMYATASDLLKLDQAMYGSSLLSSKSKELMFKSYPEYNYSGYSVWTYNYPFSPSNPRIMERRGGIKGANSVLARLLDSNKTIIILSNNNQFNPDSFGNINSLKEALIIELSKK